MIHPTLLQYSERHKEHGFTLIEVLVVVFIVALASTVIIFSLPASDKRTIVQADRLLRELNFASRESVASGLPTALFFTEDGYAFRLYREREWSENIRSTTLRSDKRSSKTRLGLLLEDEIVTNEELPTRPIVTFYPIGDATPALLVLEGDGPTRYLQVKDNAKIELSDRVLP